MNKTTVYLPDELKSALSREARRLGVSEAAFLRSALETAVRPAPVRPRGGIIRGGEPIADRVDGLLAEGFGE